MRGTATLVAHSFKRIRGFMLGTGLVLGGFQVLAALMSATFQRSGTFDQILALMPPFVRQLMGSSVVWLMSFTGMVCLGFFHLAVIGALTGLMVAVATEPVAEIERGFADLILSRAISRTVVITRSVVLLIGCSAMMLAVMVLGTWIGLWWFAPEDAQWPSPTLILSLAVNLWALMLCWGGVTLALGAPLRRRAVAASIAGLTGLVLFLLDFMARVWRPAQRLVWLSPFHYYSPLDLIMGKPIPLAHLGVLLGVAIGATGLAYLLFARRDV